ncbi:hypothetical protein ACFV0O_26885 [Kitasatospora sp. NPDC059577]
MSQPLNSTPLVAPEKLGVVHLATGVEPTGLANIAVLPVAS